MSFHRRSGITFAPGQVWRGNDGKARTILDVYTEIGVMPASVRIQSPDRNAKGYRVVTISRVAMQHWIRRESASLEMADA